MANLFANLPDRLPAELFEPLVGAPNVRIERIVSTGQASPPGYWYDQDWAEWVVVLCGAAAVVLCGAAAVLLEGEQQPRVLGPGDHLRLDAHVRHRVEWTSTAEPTVWLAVHFR